MGKGWHGDSKGHREAREKSIGDSMKFSKKDFDSRKLNGVGTKKAFPPSFKYSTSFVDKEGKNVKLNISYNRTVPSQDPNFSISGSRAGSSGQITFKPKNEPQKDLNDLWKKYHLKSNVPPDIEHRVQSIIANIELAERESDIDDLGLDGWQLTAMKELAESENETFTEAHDESYDNRFQDREGVFLEGAGEYIVFKSYDDAERSAYEYVEEQLDNEPEMFSQDWLQNHITISDTDRRIIAGEDSDSRAEDLDDEEAMRLPSHEEEFDALQEKLDDEKISDSEYEDKKEALLEKTREEYRDEIYDELYADMEDPIRYFVEEQGIYTVEDLMKQSFIQIDTQDASRDAVNTDGVAHFFAGYDGNEIELKSGAVAYRVN